jgi:DNA-directed RNA polymerase specialized sigma24 family protein
MSTIAEMDDASLSQILAALPPKEREALFRFYLLDHDADRISSELGVVAQHLRQIKSRVKAFCLSNRMQ